MNAFGDLTKEEFLSQYTGFTPSDNTLLRQSNSVDFSDIAVPDSVDWVAANKVVGVKDQGQCGSCWAFSAVGSIESAYGIETGNALISLSEQQLVDCSGAEGNEGCNGGLMDNAFQYVISNKGLCKESDYTYKAVDGTCKASSCKSAITITSFTDVAQTEAALTAALVQQPIAVAVDASSWQFYSSGIMSTCVYTQLDHGVLAVAYGTSGGKAYYTIKNSWGTSWGMSGFIQLARNVGGVGECGITQAASFPTGATNA